MRVPLSWLKEYVDIKMSPEELAQTPTMARLEAATLDYIGADWGDKIITAQITHLEKVEKSDHLNYTHVNTGNGELGVVCGAPNIKLGDKVPLALVGAQVGDITIGESKIMGYVSQGMVRASTFLMPIRHLVNLSSISWARLCWISRLRQIAAIYHPS